MPQNLVTMARMVMATSPILYSMSVPKEEVLVLGSLSISTSAAEAEPFFLLAPGTLRWRKPSLAVAMMGRWNGGILAGRR